MTTPRLKPAKPVDYIAYEPVMLALSKARALAWTLAELGAARGTIGNDLQNAIDQAPNPEETHGWLHDVVADALHSTLDEIESEYRKLGTNLLAKEAAALREKGGA